MMLMMLCTGALYGKLSSVCFFPLPIYRFTQFITLLRMTNYAHSRIELQGTIPDTRPSCHFEQSHSMQGPLTLSSLLLAFTLLHLYSPCLLRGLRRFPSTNFRRSMKEKAMPRYLKCAPALNRLASCKYIVVLYFAFVVFLNKVPTCTAPA